MKQRGGLFSHLGRVAGEKAVGYGLDCTDLFRALPYIAALGENISSAAAFGRRTACCGYLPCLL